MIVRLLGYMGHRVATAVVTLLTCIASVSIEAALRLAQGRGLEFRATLLAAIIPLVLAGPNIAAHFGVIVRLEQTREALGAANRKLEQALAEVKELRGLLPICASCKKIRDESGTWHVVERYISAHSHAQFSHGICPECEKKMYG